MPPAQQTLLVLVGLPGSGKSTIARLFQQQGWVVVCQDDLGDRKQCEAACSAALAAGHSVVIDRCNFDTMQRSHWIDIARRQAQRGRGSIRLLALCLELPVEVCLQRAVARGAHATLPADQAPAVISRFVADWQNPQQREGFAAVLVARTSEEAAAMAAQVLAEQQAAAAAAMAVPAVELAVPPAAGFSTAAPPFQPGMAWSPLLPGLQQQQGWMQQQRQHFGSRADAASSWKRPAEDQQAAPPAEQEQAGHCGQRPRSPRSPRHAGNSNNAVPFPGQHRQQQQQQQHRPRRHPWQRHSHDEPSGMQLDAGAPSAKPILMFDANGCLTSHTSMRRSAGIHQARPGIEHMRRLVDHYHIGMFSSASKKTVDVALQLLEKAAGPSSAPLFNPKFVLCRTHTMLAPEAHVAGGGKEWDTVKPLKPYFSRPHRVILVDDDSYKACPGEERNLLLMPRWHEDDPSDRMIGHLVDVLIQLAQQLDGDVDADVRPLTAGASERLAALAAEERARWGADAEELAALEALTREPAVCT